ncbi:nuclear pore complex protein Nup205 [Bacillus rossius redtenbacheri]|uniref:nuclear pore complex protein Nup205 n=1 Tax=Bacillus rossius redtenbacheri TaxID=93214 RepID=UPI002FDE9165
MEEAIASDDDRSNDLWQPYKELLNIVTAMMYRPTSEIFETAQNVLRTHRQNFLTLLRNPPKNAQSRQNLLQGIKEGITLPGVGHQLLPRELVDEAIIISDMYDLNEYLALDLLFTAHQQMPFHPGQTRGLVAVLLYYDGRKALVTALKLLVNARRGVSWEADCDPDITAYITQYTNKLMEDGLLSNILDTLECLDVAKELELLQQNRALGNPKHQHEVVTLFEGTRQALASIVFLWAVQSGLPREPAFRLMNQLKTYKIQEHASGGVDDIHLALEMALLYALDLSALQRREDTDEFVRNLPLLVDQSLVVDLMRELSPVGRQWDCVGLQALTQLAFGLALTTLRTAPQCLHPAGDRNFLDEDEVLVDTALELKVFDFLHSTFLGNATFFKEEYYLRRLHVLLTDLILLMPLKVKELRDRDDEAAHTTQMYAQEGLDPPTHLSHHFEHLLLTVARLYQDNPLGLDLAVEYWCPVDAGFESFRTQPRQVALFKFVRNAGDVLPATLFVPYLKMVRSLASTTESARHAFNMLKQNSHGSSSILSWDHFFSSFERYYSNLRQELPPTSDTVYRHRSYPRGITPQEIQGLQAVLALMRTIAELNESARVALCSGPQWMAMTVLLGLVSCSVPIPLKAELLLTLAALARSPSTAATLWHSLEASQILTTVPSTCSYQPRGIQTELEEVESRNEEFPLTRALLHLLDVLTDVQVPSLLGVGMRTPGFDPYLKFVLNSVFLRFNCRAYKNPHEKWEVSRGCLKLLVKFISQYEPQAEDFVGRKVDLQGGGITHVNPSPGHQIMLCLNTKSEHLRLVLEVIHIGCQLLDAYQPFPGKEALEDTTLLCLELLSGVLGLQQAFLTALGKSGCHLLITGLSKLLREMNPCSGSPDHLLNVARYVTYNYWLPHHALNAVRILLSVTTSPTIHTQLVGLFTSTPSLTLEIRQAFVECLDAEIQGDDEEGKVRTALKEDILKLLLQCLDHGWPNTSHYLFGFQLNQDIKKMVFRQAGVMGTPRNCLHALTSLLNEHVLLPGGAQLQLVRPGVVELGYHTLYALCANLLTSDPVLRFLRSCGDFLALHVAALPFTGTDRVKELSQMSWLLKTVAVELKVTARKRQQSHLSALVQQLVLKPEAIAEATSARASFLRSIDVASETVALMEPTLPDNRKVELIVHLISFIEFSKEPETSPSWEFFDPDQIEQVFLKCETGGTSRPRLVDIKQLHRVLMDELHLVQGTSTAGQRQLILQEIESILEYAVGCNARLARVAASLQLMEAWSEVVGTLFAVTPADILPLEQRTQLLVETVHKLLSEVVSESDQVVPQLAMQCSTAVMLLLVNLRASLVARRLQERHAAAALSPALVRTAKSDASMTLVLNNLLSWILTSGGKSQKMRAYLFASLLNYLFVMCDNTGPVPSGGASSLRYFFHRLDSSQYVPSEPRLASMRRSVLEGLVRVGDSLIQTLCRDCTSGHQICKILALSTLDKLLSLEHHKVWIAILGRGYIKRLVCSLQILDQQLAAALEPVPDTLNPIFVYESLMALLCRVASTAEGARMLLENDVLGCLCSLQILDRHPDIRTKNTPKLVTVEEDFFTSVSARYMQVFLPALNLCDALITTLGTENLQCMAEIQRFLVSHKDVVSLVLHSGSPHVEEIFLKELARLTGIIACVSYPDISPSEQQPDLERTRKQMLCLFSRFLMWEGLRQWHSQERVLHFFQTACHATQFARYIVTRCATRAHAVGIVFRPVLADANRVHTDAWAAGGGRGEVPTLGSVVQQLVQCVDHHHRERASLEALGNKLAGTASMTTAELHQVLGEDDSTGAEGVESAGELRVLVAQRLDRCTAMKRRELELCANLIESTLYLLWCHLDMYMRRAIPHSRFSLTLVDQAEHDYTTPFAESGWKVMLDEISQLKQGLVSVFNDSFSRKLVETAQEGSSQDDVSVQRDFLEVMLRRIKRLLQFVPVK